MAYKGFTGIIAGSIYTVLAFAGFEAAAPLAERRRDRQSPLNIWPRWVGATLGISGTHLAFSTTYAMDVCLRSRQVLDPGGAGASLWLGLAKASYGIFWVLVFFAIVNSTIANSNAGSNVSTRMAFALGRIHLLPRFLRHHPPRISPCMWRCDSRSGWSGWRRR